MDVYQRAWASLLQRIEAKTSWGRNELKQQMLEALVEAGETSYLDKDGNPMQFESGHTWEARTPKIEIGKEGELPW